MGGILAVAIVWLAYAAPLTKDEAYNRVYYGGFSVAKILQHYDSPNNHLLDTVLESRLPQGMIAWDPWTLRVIGVASGIALLLLVLVLAARRRALLLALCLVGGSPLLVTYLFVARGYGLSALLALLSIVVPIALAPRVRHVNVLPGAVLLGLAAWPVPTNLWLVPGWIAGVAALWGLVDVLLASAVLAPLLAVEYYPIKGDIPFVARLTHGTPSVADFLGDLLHGAAIVPVCFLAGVALIVVAIVRQPRRWSLAALRTARPSVHLAVWCASTSGSWLLGTLIAHAFGDQLPFARNGVPALWLAVTALVAAAPPTRLRLVANVILLVPFVVGVVLWARASVNDDWKPVAGGIRSDVLFMATPRTIRDVSSIHADLLACSSLDEPVCQLDAHDLARSGVEVRLHSGPYVPGLRCALGSRRPPPPYQVIVYRRGAVVGQLCH